MSGIDDPHDLGTIVAKVADTEARKRDGREPPVAMCPRCHNEVLVATLRWPGSEFYCLNCDGHYGFLAPRAAESTPVLEARIFAAEREFKRRFPR